MDPIVLGIFVVGVVATIFLPPFLIKHTSQQRRFEQMDGLKLIQANVHAGMMKGRLRLAAYLIPLPVIIIVRCFSGYEHQGMLIGLAFLVIFACLSGAQFFGEIDKLTTAEMESRKDVKPDTGSKNDPPDKPGS